MGKRFRSGGLKVSKSLAKCRTITNKIRQTKDKDVGDSSLSSINDAYWKRGRTSVVNEDKEDFQDVETKNNEEHDEEEEMEVQKEPSLYDNLLMKLEASRKPLVNGHQIRTSKERYTSDSEDGDDCATEEEQDEPGGTRNNSGSGTGDVGGSSGEEDSDMAGDDNDASDPKSVSRELRENDIAISSQSQSEFDIHILHKLSKEDTKNLLEGIWNYTWHMPALDATNSRWMGTGDCFVKDVDVPGTAPSGLKLKLYKHWLEVYASSGGKDFQSSKQRYFFSLCNSYRDILHHNKKGFYQKGSDEDSSIMDAYIMHSLNHVFRTRDLVTKNDAKLAKYEKTVREEVLARGSFRDQGFTRPKVLILLPLGSIALRLVRRLIQLTPSTNKVNVEYMDRFNKEFGVDIEEDEDEHDPKKPPKPSDYQALFGGKNNDHFMVGIKFTRRSVRLYSDFYSSDMIIASPLGVITKIGEAEANKGKDVDYLSSIEILIVDHADLIAMQNWTHVVTVVQHLNRLPSKEHGGNIMRLRPWFVDEQSQFYRQSIILSGYLNPDINSLFNRGCLNFEGKLKLSCEYRGVLPKVVWQIRQVYERFDCDSAIEDHDARLNHFVKKVFPKVKDSIQGGIMLFISHYFDFVRIRNFLKSQNASFCLVSEQTKQSDISRARNWFIQGQRKIMLYTERAHFYHRYKIKGVQTLIIYSLPERKEFYPEVLNMLEGSHNMTCTALFSRFDKLKLERIVGTAAAKRMTRSEKGLFIFN